MSATQSPPAGAPPAAVPRQPAARDICPLCGGPLHREQDWCLKCGAAARTRLAAAPNWKGPVIALVLVVAISLGVLAAALIKLAGESGSSSPPTTITRAASAPVVPAPTASTAAALPTTATSGAAAAAPPSTVTRTATRTSTTTITKTGTSAFKLGAASAAGEVGARTTPAARVP